MDHYLTQEKPYKAIMKFSIPMIIAALFQQVYTLVDSLIVGRYVGESALASIGASFSLTTIFICIAIGGGVGASVLIARYFGAKSYKNMKTAVYTSIISFLILAICLSIFGLIFSKDIMILLHTPSNILDLAVIYLDIYFYGLPFLFMYNIISALYNCLGESKIPLYFLIFSSMLNVVLDVYMVRDLKMGIEGAAYATLLAQGIAAVLSFILFLTYMRKFKVKVDNVFNLNELKLMAKLAIPSIIQQSTITIGQVLVQSVVNSFGTEILAGFTAAFRVESLIIVPLTSLGNAVSSYTSQNIGSGKKKRVSQGLKSSLIIVFLICFIICIYLRISYKSIIGAFMNKSSSKLAYETGFSYLKFIAFFFVFVGSKQVVDGVLRGLGDVRVFTISNIVNLSIRVSLSMIFAPIIGISMVWYAVPLGWLANLVISSIYYFYLKKRNFRLRF